MSLQYNEPLSMIPSEQENSEAILRSKIQYFIERVKNGIWKSGILIWNTTNPNCILI